MNKDTFLTTQYKPDYFIHSCYNRDTKSEEFQVQFAPSGCSNNYQQVEKSWIVTAKSYHAAKCMITKILKHNNGV